MRTAVRTDLALLLTAAFVSGVPAAVPAAEPSPSATSVCDPDLIVEHASATAYRMRGNRCEGVHSLKISSDTKLVVASLSAHFDFSLETGADLQVEWPLPSGAGPVHLRGRSLGDVRRGLHYRMDAEVPAGHSRFAWPVDVLALLRLEPADLGLLAWTRMPAAGEQAPRVYLPLRVGQAAAQGASGAVYRLLLVPAERLEEVFLTLTRSEGDGDPGAPLVDARPLGLGYYPANRPTWVEVPVPDDPGLYRIDLAARLYRDPASTLSTSLRFYHADGSP